ncbi:universal stress protein [Sporolactobacillus shoreicorticis]|uniref:Universal stress protein n=1 Tax=Sporolactobacillus shoreicorticis TaxID=1923877 RepID=A0ABW5S1W6_9BACL|nr:universal stress protein [Sporolactobacillus shoreicorticis]MCO7125311.1 universal stress protein [Sporolactobacillus shoreicorticis]
MGKKSKHLNEKEREGNHSVKKKGKLKIIVGAAPGSGKTYKLLKEANDLLKKGTDIVIGFVEVHQRPETAQQVGDLEIIPCKKVLYQNRTFEEMDVDAIIERQPAAVVVDELAHTNLEGSRFSKRYMDVDYILDQGIDVLTTVNVQHLEETYREAEKITGVRIREIVPQSFIESADEIEVVDVPPETLRQRMRDGNIFHAGTIHQALDHFFKKENLSALRELTLRIVADTVDNQFQKSFERQSIPGPVGAKEVILVCTSFLARSAVLIRKGYRMARRMKADLYILTILEMPENDLSGKNKDRINKLRSLADFCGADYIAEQRADRVLGKVVMDVAEKLGVTQIVVGQTHAPQPWIFWKSNLVRYLLLHMKYADLHIMGWKEGGLPYSLTDTAKRNRSGPLPDPNTRRGRLTICVGSAPGVGKTYKMLQDANDRLSKGTDVVIGFIETHGRKETAGQIGRLETIPLRVVHYNGRRYGELDVAQIIRRHPEMVLVDELAHTNVPGSEREKRFQDILYILGQGIDVVTAVNIQHLESLRDTVEHITGVKVKERIPDWFMDWAEEIKLIDVSPEVLQSRLAQGKVYSKDKVEHAMNHFFRLGNLSVLRELALFEVADNVDQSLDRQRVIGEPPRILTCVNYRPHSEKLIRRGWRIADRYNADLYVLAVVSDKPLQEREKRDLETMKKLSEQLRATFLSEEASENRVGEMIAKMAEELHAEQIVVGQPLPAQRFFDKLKHNPVIYVLMHAEFVNLHVVANSRGEYYDER